MQEIRNSEVRVNEWGSIYQNSASTVRGVLSPRVLEVPTRGSIPLLSVLLESYNRFPSYRDSVCTRTEHQDSFCHQRIPAEEAPHQSCGLKKKMARSRGNGQLSKWAESPLCGDPTVKRGLWPACGRGRGRGRQMSTF